MSQHKSAKKKVEGNEDPEKKLMKKCSYCGRDITNEVYVRCAKCIGFIECLECFSVGAETASHFHTHPYIIIEPMHQVVYRKGWTAEEEFLLLHGIQVCGLGNWHEIENIVQTKNAIECETHYFGTYLQSPIAPMPLDEVLPEAVLPPPPEYDTSPRDSRPSISHDKNLADRGKKDRTTPAEFAGWMPRRNEFEVEYQNEAEQLIANITFTENDTAQSLEQNLRFLRVYNEILEERHNRTQFAIEWDLFDEDFRSFGGKTKSEREMEEALMPLAQVVPRKPLTEFIQSVERESQLRESILTLIKWRKNGIATRDEGLMFNELEKLMNEEKLTPAQVEAWNKKQMMKTESPEFRATLIRQLLDTSENNLCHQLSISPNMYLNLKDLLIREFTARGEMTEELAVSFSPGQEEYMRKVYEHIKAKGLFWNPAEKSKPKQEQKKHNE